MQGFNRYYPPDYDPKKVRSSIRPPTRLTYTQGGLNKQQGKHALGDRARKLDQGILIIRFELPFSIWCDGCGSHIGQGVRYNAEKKKVGNYYSTTIWSFRMKCHLCSNWFEIQTDPKNTQYVVTAGAKAKIEEWDPEDTGVIKIKSDAEAEQQQDPFAKLEKDINDGAKAKQAAPRIATLHELSDKQWADPFKQSQLIRKRFRQEKKVLKETARKTQEIMDRNSLSIPLLDEIESDATAARLTDFDHSRAEQKAAKRLKIAEARNLFGKGSGILVDGKPRPDPSNALLQQARVNTRIRKDPFAAGFKQPTRTVTKPDGQVRRGLIDYASDEG